MAISDDTAALVAAQLTAAWAAKAEFNTSRNAPAVDQVIFDQYAAFRERVQRDTALKG